MRDESLSSLGPILSAQYIRDEIAAAPTDGIIPEMSDLAPTEVARGSDAAAEPGASTGRLIVVPEPSTITMMGVGLAALFAYNRAGRKKPQ